MRLRIDLGYDGAGFHGWARQPGLRTVQGDLETALDTLEGAVSGTEFVAGDRFSAADLYVASHLGWGMQFGTIPKRPAFESYAGRHLARPAAVRAREIDDGLLAQAGSAA